MAEKAQPSAEVLASSKPTALALKAWSKEVRDRDENRCRKCGSTGILHAHHIQPKGQFPELALEITNGVTLCIPCHAETHGGTLGRIIQFPKPTKHRVRREQPPLNPTTGPMTAETFNQWLRAMGISCVEACRLLGVQPNTITRYRRNGAPKAIALACSALFHRLGEWKCP